MAVYQDPNDPDYDPYPRDPGEHAPAPNPDPTPEPTPKPPAPPDPWATAPTDGNWEKWFRTNLGRDTLSSAELLALEASLNKAGIQVIRNAAGIAGKIRLPAGQIVDVIERAGAGGNRFQWSMGGGETGGGGNGGVDLDASSIDPSYLSPFDQAAPSRGAAPVFNGPGEFRAPTQESLLSDPSYLWRLDQGRGAIENSAAAKGVLNSGGTLSDILNYGQKAGSQEYGAQWDRAYGVWNSDWNNSMNKFRADSDSGETNYQRAWQQYVDAKDTWYRNQNEPFNKLISAARIGAGAAAS